MKHCYPVRLVAGIALVMGILSGCSLENSGTENGPLIIASWNVQALFDGTNTGTEYSDYQNSWTGEKYHSRLNAIAAALKEMDDSGREPAVLGLIEIENGGILDDLAAMNGFKYHWTFFAKTPGASLGLGLVSRFPIIEARTHSVNFSGIEAPRPIAEVWIDAGGEDPLAVFVCHWKSKLGGAKETEVARRAAAAILARRLEEIEADLSGTPVIIMGDLNENHDEYVRLGGAYPCALVPAEAAAPDNASPRPNFRDFLILSGERPPTALNNEPTLYSPWMDGQAHDRISAGGSYYYQEAWETIDHFLLSASLFDNSGWEFSGFAPAFRRPFTTANGVPDAYNPRTGNGLSDHLPIMLYLARAP